MEWATLPLKKYADFTGRARRKEYWMYVLLAMVLYVIAYFVDVALGLSGTVGGIYGPAYLLVALGLFIPSLAVAIRRLHDTDRSGWWFLIIFTGIGAIVLLVFFVSEGTRGPNRFGDDPKVGEAATA